MDQDKLAESCLGKQSRCLLIWKNVILSLLMAFAILGVMVFSPLHNYSAATSCLLLNSVCLLYLVFNIAVMNGNAGLQKLGHSKIKLYFILAVIDGVIMVAAVIAFEVLGHLNNQYFTAEGNSYYIVVIPNAIGAIIAPFLAYETRIAMALVPPVTVPYAGMNADIQMGRPGQMPGIAPAPKAKTDDWFSKWARSQD